MAQPRAPVEEVAQALAEVLGREGLQGGGDVALGQRREGAEAVLAQVILEEERGGKQEPEEQEHGLPAAPLGAADAGGGERRTRGFSSVVRRGQGEERADGGAARGSGERGATGESLACPELGALQRSRPPSCCGQPSLLPLFSLPEVLGDGADFRHIGEVMAQQALESPS